ncbi:MAG: Fpg/Nei family DNA glycosylase, partial [Propionibacterium sp.]|nr:Fpg/Nei family DNA glycosylase [Propionibacterium sp.]
MPEGDTVHQLATRLRPLEGRRITGWDARTPTLATTDATGAVVEAVWPWGKHLFWRLRQPAGADILHTHLG